MFGTILVLLSMPLAFFLVISLNDNPDFWDSQLDLDKLFTKKEDKDDV